MEHPPKQGLKPVSHNHRFIPANVLMEHPPKQGLKRQIDSHRKRYLCPVLMEHPPKQGLKLNCDNLLNHRLAVRF